MPAESRGGAAADVVVTRAGLQWPTTDPQRPTKKSLGGLLLWTLLVIGGVASLAAKVAVAEPTATGRVIAAWPSFALIASYELLMRQVRHAAEAGTSQQRSGGIQAGQEPRHRL